jgi:hypothetical protein
VDQIATAVFALVGRLADQRDDLRRGELRVHGDVIAKK